jgi:hypothetical protein
MLGPNHATVHMANTAYEERASHAARIHQIQRERREDQSPVTSETHRLFTVRRLAAAGLAGFVLSAALVAGGATAAAASPHGPSGGGAILIR